MRYWRLPVGQAAPAPFWRAGPRSGVGGGGAGSRRAQLEIALEEAQRDPVYALLGLPYLRPGPRLPSDAIEHVLGLFDELRRERAKPTATPEEAREANVG